MDCNLSSTGSTSDIWLAASISEGHTVYHRPAQPGPDQPGSLREQWQVLNLAAANPWEFLNPDDALAAARRTILSHAKRRAR